MFVVRIYCAYQRARLPFEVDYEVGNVLNAGLRLLEHQTPYPPPGSFPYILNPYGPIGYVATAAGIRTFGLSFFGPRLIVLLSGLLIAFLIASFVQHFGGEPLVAWLAGLMYLCCTVVWRWYPLLRVDFWAVLLSLLGLYIFAAFPRFRFTCVVFFAAAILTKAAALAAPLARGIELLAKRKFKEFFSGALLLVGLLGITAVLLGRNFRFAMFSTHPDPYILSRVFRLYYYAIEAVLLPIMTIGLALFAGLRFTSSSRLAWIYAAATSVTSLTAGKLGSETNHLLEWTAAILILAGLALSYLFNVRSELARPLLFASIVMSAVLSFLPEKTVTPGPNRNECESAYVFVRSFPGKKILSEDIGALVLSRKPVLVSNPFVVTQLGSRVLWSRGSLDSLVSQRYFDLILLGGEVKDFQPDSGRWSPLLVRNTADEYRLERKFRCSPYLSAAYIPRGGESTSPASAATPTSPSRPQSDRP